MGNRCVITNTTRTKSIYQHWNGGMDSIKPMLEVAKELGKDIDGLFDISNKVFDGEIIGSGHYNTEDNGVYVIDDNLNIVDREHKKHFVEQRHHDKDNMKIYILCHYLLNGYLENNIIKIMFEQYMQFINKQKAREKIKEFKEKNKDYFVIQNHKKTTKNTFFVNLYLGNITLGDEFEPEYVNDYLIDRIQFATSQLKEARDITAKLMGYCNIKFASLELLQESNNIQYKKVFCHHTGEFIDTVDTVKAL